MPELALELVLNVEVEVEVEVAVDVGEAETDATVGASISADTDADATSGDRLGLENPTCISPEANASRDIAISREWRAWCWLPGGMNEGNVLEYAQCLRSTLGAEKHSLRTQNQKPQPLPRVETH